MSAQRQASSASQIPHISPAELSYLYTSLALPGSPIRPDGRSPTQFRPLTAETDILPGTNGSARVGFADGTQAIVGVKAEVERTVLGVGVQAEYEGGEHDGEREREGNEGERAGHAEGQGSWVQMAIEIPGFRDDDALPVFLAEMMREPLVESVSGSEDGTGADMVGGLKGRLVINRRWHWRLYIDVLLLSQPLSYPLPLLSLTTHLALLATKLPKLKSKGEEDPFFDDDWNAAEYLYPRAQSKFAKPSIPSSISVHKVRPPVTLLVISVAENIIFDPSREEIAVADAVLAISITHDSDSGRLKLLSIRTIDPPSRLTQPGVPNSENVATLGSTNAAEEPAIVNASTGEEEVPGVWKPRRGGVKRATIARMVKMVLERGGVGEEVLEGLEGVEVG
ncbi:ribosomal protein S5 domain 2-type protein [Aspergillus karnatakaensis]|uniref:exosome non-catalytic core subunit RRP42 n=1 Tax=Aspergillus karnatakaensis TaxID=1810916 RepID=UPI003CCE138C